MEYYLKGKDAAECLGIAIDKLYYLAKSGKIQTIKTLGQPTLFSVGDGKVTPRKSLPTGGEAYETVVKEAIAYRQKHPHPKKTIDHPELDLPSLPKSAPDWRYVGAAGLAKACRVSPEALYIWCAKKVLAGFRCHDGSVKFDVLSVRQGVVEFERNKLTKNQ